MHKAMPNSLCILLIEFQDRIYYTIFTVNETGDTEMTKFITTEINDMKNYWQNNRKMFFFGIGVYASTILAITFAIFWLINAWHSKREEYNRIKDKQGRKWYKMAIGVFVASAIILGAIIGEAWEKKKCGGSV